MNLSGVYLMLPSTLLIYDQLSHRTTGKQVRRLHCLRKPMIDGAPILIVGDCQQDVDLLKRALGDAGLPNPVLTARDEAETIAYLSGVEHSDNAFCPLLMFLDLNRAGHSGFSVLNWLRQQPELQSLPTIVLSSSTHQEDIDQSFELGAHGYWVKPSRFEDLVRRLMGLRELLIRVTKKVEVQFPLSAAA